MPTPTPADWPTYQVDDGNTGHHPSATGPDGPVEACWTKRTEHVIGTAPIIADGRLFVGTNGGTLFALDPESGGVEWQFQAPEQVASAVAVIQGNVYVGNVGIPRGVIGGTEVGGRAGDTEALHVLDADTGAQIGSTGTIGGVSASLSVYDDSLVFGASSEAVDGDGAVYRLDADTLEPVWHAGFSSNVYTTPALGGEHAYVGTRDGMVVALDLETGERRWSEECDDSDAQITGVAAAGSVVVGTNMDGTVCAFERGTGSLLWRADPNAYAGPAIANETVYVGTHVAEGAFYAFDLETGEVCWTNDCSQYVLTPPTVADGRVYFGTGYDDGRLYAIDAASGETTWSYAFETPADSDLPGHATAPATVCNGRVYVSVDDVLYALGEET